MGGLTVRSVYLSLVGVWRMRILGYDDIMDEHVFCSWFLFGISSNENEQYCLK